VKQWLTEMNNGEQDCNFVWKIVFDRGRDNRNHDPGDNYGGV
jgi:hypothetical protein